MAPARPARPLTGRRLGLLAGALLAVLTVAALVATGVLATKVSAASSRDDRREAALAAARQQAVNFTTLDYRHLDRDLGRVLAGSTGAFKRQFRSGTKDLEQLVTANQAVSKGQVLEAGLVTSDADSARVLVVADSTVTNTASPDGTKRHYRIQMDLVHLPGGPGSGRWLVSDLTFVG